MNVADRAGRRPWTHTHPAKVWITVAAAAFVGIMVGKWIMGAAVSAYALWKAFMIGAGVLAPIHTGWWLRRHARPRKASALFAELAARDQPVVLADEAAIVLRRWPVGKVQLRPNAVAAITADGFFLRFFGARPPVEVPRDAVTGAEVVREYRGQALMFDALRIAGVPKDSTRPQDWALRVSDPGAWARVLTATPDETPAPRSSPPDPDGSRGSAPRPSAPSGG